MPKTVLIILAAVIALIAIVVYLGTRYLRADDEDDFDDDVPSEHGRFSSRGSHLPHEQPRTRRHHDDDLPDERLRERPGAVRVTAGRGSDRGPDRAAAGRGGDDRGWREDSGLNGRAGRASLPQRDQRPGRSGRLDDDDISEPIAASARSGRSSAGRSGQHGLADYEGRTTRMPAAARDYDGDDGRGRDRLARAEDRDSRDRRDSRDTRDGRDRRDVRAATSTRDTGGARDIGGADRDERDRRSTTRPGTRPDNRKNGAVADDLLPPVKPRQGRSKKDADGDWPSNEWDELSDVDYWAELASDRPLTTDKPLTSAAKPAERSRSERGETRLDAAPGPVRGERPDAAAARESRSKQPGRPARQPDQIRQPDPPIVPPVTRKLDVTDRSDEFSGTGSRRASLGRTERLQAVPQPAAPGRDSRYAIPADDDPLTSPSFPRIPADDSRSYRRSRTPGPDELPTASRTTDTGSHRVREQAQSREQAYPAVPRAEPVRGLDGLTQPHSYQRPAEGDSGYGVASPDYERAAADYSGSATEPYRAPSTSSVPGSYQVPAVASADRYPSSTGAYPGPASSTASYSLPATSGGYGVPSGSAHASPAGGGYPAADSGSYASPAGTGSGGYQASGATPAPGYPPAAAGHGGYGGETVVRGTYPDPASYQPSPPSAGGYQADQGVGGQPAAGTSSYAFPAEPASYPGQADPLASYQGYAGSGPASASHPRPDPGYLAGSYPASLEPSFGGALPGGQPEVGYPIYSAPVPVGQTTAYQVPGPLPGSAAGPGNDYAAGSTHAPPSGYPEPQYRPDLYDQPGYQVPVPENGGYAGADPYAMDPYGYSGYGNGGH